MTVYRIIKWLEQNWWVFLIPVALAVGSFYLFAHRQGHDLHKLTFGLGGLFVSLLAFGVVVSLVVMLFVCLVELFRRKP